MFGRSCDPAVPGHQAPPDSAAPRLSSWPSSCVPRARSSPGDGAGDGRGEPEGDRRRRRAETAFEWDPVDEVEALSGRRREECIGADSEVRLVGWELACSLSLDERHPSPSVTSSSFQRSSATAAQSNPGPRFADVAGARTSSRRGLRDRIGVGFDRDRRGGMCGGALGILEPVAGDHAHDSGPAGARPARYRRHRRRSTARRRRPSVARRGCSRQRVSARRRP